MKILFVSTNEKSGGAAVASKRIFDSINLEKKMFVQKKESNSNIIITKNNFFNKYFILFKKVFERLTIKLFGGKTNNFSTSIFLSFNSKLINTSDLIHLQWINNGFLSIKDISKINKPIVWTLHDMWAFTGGCHYSGKCKKFEKSCSNCPILENEFFDLSKHILEKKLKLWKSLDLTVVCPSKWLASEAKKSKLFSRRIVKIIPNGIDLNIFKKGNVIQARKKFNLPLDKNLILFGAINSTNDLRKGFDLLDKSLKELLKNKLNLELVVFGSNMGPKELCGYKVNYLGSLNENEIISAYSACDCFVAPSREDNLPNTIMEALACSMPVVAFNVGGIPDMVEHKKNGYLAQPFDVKDLANGIKWVIKNNINNKLSKNARKKCEKEFDIKIISAKYIKLYKKILSDQK
jgi:glycosyltransferase involved in cell wall biosynthesis